MRLDHIIKERYPTFVDALRDLDDALSMIFLFANLPSQAHVDHKKIALCQRLALEFEHYLITTHSLRKSFLSIKGIYYQATIQGQDILWLVPYKFVQRVSGDVDFRIMDTFLEFYTTLLGFVNFRLYSSIGLVYPPTFNVKSDEAGGELGAYTLQGRPIDSESQLQLEDGNADDERTANAQLEATSRAQALADSIKATPDTPSTRASPAPSEPNGEDADSSNQPTSNTEIDKFPTASTNDVFDILPQPGPSSNEAGTLFANTTFYLSRETPRQPLEFLLKAFGCRRVGWNVVLGDGAHTTDEADQSITHQVVDRPLLATTDNEPTTNGTTEHGEEAPISSAPRPGRYPNRTYIQPQWVWDCVNAGQLLPPADYGPGAVLPPHLSPFVRPRAGTYDPTQPLEPTEEEAEAMEGTTGAVDEMDEDEDSDVQDEDVEFDDGMDEEDTELNGEANGFSSLDIAASQPVSDDFAGFSDEEDAARQAELEAEALGQTVSGKGEKGKALKSALKKPSRKERLAKEEGEQRERQKMMLSRKKRKLYEKMEYSNKKKDDEKERLVGKRAED